MTWLFFIIRIRSTIGSVGVTGVAETQSQEYRCAGDHAVGYENLGVPDRALQYYESLYLLQSNPTVLYKMAFLQLALKRYRKVALADILIADKNVEIRR